MPADTSVNISANPFPFACGFNRKSTSEGLEKINTYSITCIFGTIQLDPFEEILFCQFQLE